MQFSSVKYKLLENEICILHMWKLILWNFNIPCTIVYNINYIQGTNFVHQIVSHFTQQSSPPALWWWHHRVPKCIVVMTLMWIVIHSLAHEVGFLYIVNVNVLKLKIALTVLHNSNMPKKSVVLHNIPSPPVLHVWWLTFSCNTFHLLIFRFQNLCENTHLWQELTDYVPSHTPFQVQT